MKMKKAWIALASVAVITLVGCGGGGSTEVSDTGDTTQEKYAGSILPGDFIEMTRHGAKVEYNITGSVFGSILSNVDVTEVPEGHGYLFTGLVSGEEAGFLFAGGLTLASLPISGTTHMAIGVKEMEGDLTTSDVVGVYAYTEANFEPDGTFEGAQNCQITIDVNHTAIAKCIGNPDVMMRWDFTPDFSHLVIREGDLSLPVTKADAQAAIAIKQTPTGARKSFVVDRNGGQGFAIGLEEHHITQDDVAGEYLIIDFKEGEHLTITLDPDDSNTSLLHTMLAGTDVGSVHINHDCGGREVPGISCIKDSDDKNHTGMIDTQSGYLFAAANDSSSGEANFIIGIKLP